MNLTTWCLGASFLAIGCVTPKETPAIGEAEQALTLPNNFLFGNSAGALASFSSEGGVDLDSEFFVDFGTNERTCGSCHFAEHAWGVSAARVRQLFNQTGGTHPIFRPVDGANSPLADVSTVAKRRAAYSMLRNRGVIRVGIGVASTAEFELTAVDDPYGFASAGELSLFRRPLPSTNLGFIPTVMWDGREATGVTIDDRLGVQANNATLGHAEADVPLAPGDRDAIVLFETALTSAQLRDRVAGRLDAAGARGGPELLAGMAFVNARFDLFDAWLDEGSGSPRDARRAAIARGQELFNNPNAGAGGGACRGCHSAANVGASVAPIFFDIGTSAGSRRTADLPLYTLRNKTTGETRTTTDPGRALITGLWSDVDRFRAPNLRGLAGRGPYFHAGSAETLADVVAFYEESLAFDFTPAEEADLVAFLSAL
jgi:cytochrome c553